jgi:hypothetical protein
MSTYLARVRHDGSVRIYRNNQSEPVSRPFTLPRDGTSLRKALRAAGWRPTGRDTLGGDWGSIYVERLAPSREGGRPPTEEPAPMDERARRFSERFRKVSDRYPLRVAEAYDYYLDPAMADSDELVAATVAGWERRQGVPVRDWRAIGAEEHGPADDERGD